MIGNPNRKSCSPVAAAALLLAAGAHPAAATAAELLVVEAPRCGPCLLFDREIGALYPKTEEGRLAPLRRVAFGFPAPEPHAFVGQAKVAPTFVLVEGGREIGRFEGYSNDELFWLSLAALMQKLPGR